MESRVSSLRVQLSDARFNHINYNKYVHFQTKISLCRKFNYLLSCHSCFSHGNKSTQKYRNGSMENRNAHKYCDELLIYIFDVMSFACSNNNTTTNAQRPMYRQSKNPLSSFRDHWIVMTTFHLSPIQVDYLIVRCMMLAMCTLREEKICQFIELLRGELWHPLSQIW